MAGKLHPSSERVQEALHSLGCASQVVELSSSTATASEAAQAVGGVVGQIAKSLIFLAGGKPIMVIASGANRVDTRKLADIAGGVIGKANAETVREITGFSIGGVPPVGLKSQLPIFIDQDLLGYNEIWAAAGTPRSVFKLAPSELICLTGGIISDIAERQDG